jgi:hypothetical protein
MTENKSTDLLGVKPFGDSIKILTQGAVDGAAAFLGRICLPAAEEFGLLLKDRVSSWRSKNAIGIATKAEKILTNSGRQNHYAYPRLAVEIVEKGSWAEDDIFQAAWAGLLASSCTENGDDDSNILFASLLEQLTKVQIRILNYACENVAKYVAEAGWIQAGEIVVSSEQLIQITGVDDLHRIDRELDHLRSLGLISVLKGGFHSKEQIADISPTPLALNLYVRCQGYVGSPIDYWGITEPFPEDATELMDNFDGIPEE